MLSTEKLLASQELKKSKLEDERRKRWAELGDTDIMKLSEVARMLGMCDRTVYALAMNHKIPATKIGTQWRFSRKILTEFIQGKRDCYGALRNGQEISSPRIPECSIGDSLTGKYQQGSSISNPCIQNKKCIFGG